MSDGISTERQQHYDDFQKNTKSTGEMYKVPYKSSTEYTDLPVYEIPIGDDFKTGLRYNLDNSRIIQHVQFKQSKGEKLDPAEEKTQKIIEEILLNSKTYSKNATDVLTKNLDSSGQREPVIISCDGVIWNGNRRTAIMRKQYTDTGDDKWSRVKGVFLPQLEKKKLKKLEHRLQIARDFKEDYDKMTLLLECRMRIKEGWSPKELVNSFNDRYSEKQIEEFIKQINLIDDYLVRIGRPKDYLHLEGKKGAEFFAATQSHLEFEKNRLKTSEAGLEKIRTEFFAAAVNPQTTYQDARNLSKVLKDKKSRETYLKNSQIYNNYREYTVPDKNGNERAFAPETVNAVSNNITSTHAELRAMAVDTPLDLAEKALKKLLDIKESDLKGQEFELLDTLTKVMDRVNKLKSYLT